MWCVSVVGVVCACVCVGVVAVLAGLGWLDDEEREEGKGMTLWRQDASTQGGYVKAVGRRRMRNPKDATTLER